MNSLRIFIEKIVISFVLLGAINSSYAAQGDHSEEENALKITLWDPCDYGAIGDGTTLDTKAIQMAIDKCHENGGGKVYIHNGQFISGAVYLKSNVTHYIEAGAVLRASDNLDNFPIIPSNYPSYEGTFVTNKMLIYAEDAKNISITGRGTIDGNGDHWVDGPYGTPTATIRPRIIHFRGCENILIRDVTLYNSAS